MIVGYARTSSLGQVAGLEAQERELQAAGCTKVFREQVWTRDEEQRFLAVARPSLRRAIMLMLYTVQRPSDCLSMTTSRIREKDNRLYISLRQQKTGELLDVPVHSALEPLLRQRLAPDWKPEPLSNQRNYGNAPATVLLARPASHGPIGTFAVHGT